jgi:aminopeptidase N
MLRRLAVVAAAATLSLPGAAVARQAAPGTPGAPGLGDPYWPLDGNGGYDTRHYALELSYDPPTDTLRGVATIAARATQDLSSFNLDLDGLTVRSITVGGDAAAWTRDGSELTVTPPRTVRDHRAFTTVIAYDGVPQTISDVFGVSGFFHTDDGTVVAGEPDVAATWYPVNDHPLDKASYTFRITVPEGLEAIANGVLRSRRTRGGSTTWVWQAREPMAPYLTTATIGEFDLRAYRVGDIQYWDAIDPDLLAGSRAAEALARQPEIIGFLSGLFGPYPFSAAGGIVDDFEGLEFSLENQTRPVYARQEFEGPGPVDSVVVHELAHQWVGNDLALAAWPHIWLNEGFATYTEWLWSEREGRGTAQEVFDVLASIPAEAPFWSVTIGDPGPDLLFDGAVYGRGAMTLHALRREIGDTAFFRLLREWTRAHAGGNVTTPEFVALAERVSGRALDAFFDAWLFTPAKPAGAVPVGAPSGPAPPVLEASASAHRRGTEPRRPR